MSEAIKVLDHGHVRLVDHMGNDLSISRNARVSYDAEWRAGEDEGSDARLISYLLKNRHSTPFEAVTFTFDVKAPIFVLRQWHRHRTWCLAGDTQLEFIRPCDGKPYKLSIQKLEASWNPKVAKRRRKDQSPLALAEHNRQRIQGMNLRCRGADGEISQTKILDVWKSGVKKVFEVVAGGRKIKASADHKFFSQGSWVSVGNLEGRCVTLLHVGGDKLDKSPPVFTEKELNEEQWVEFEEGYRVSNLGRVQSRWGLGARKLKNEWFDKKVTINKVGRSVVGIHNALIQVSVLVAKAFLPSPERGQVYARHINDNPADNRVSNLAWGTAKQNAEDSKRNGSRSIRAWVEYPVESVTEVGEEETYDISVEHEEHCFVANNFLVHNCYNELSARYRELPEEFYVPELDQITTQHTSNKQMRTDEVNPNAGKIAAAMRMQNAMAFKTYHAMIADGCPRELARCVLPVATYSHMFATVNLHNLFGFLRLRDHDHAQHEIRVYAQAMLELIEPIVPCAVKAFKAHG